jgi:hypothetical protein
MLRRYFSVQAEYEDTLIYRWALESLTRKWYLPFLIMQEH